MKPNKTTKPKKPREKPLKIYGTLDEVLKLSGEKKKK